MAGALQLLWQSTALKIVRLKLIRREALTCASCLSLFKRCGQPHFQAID